MKKKNLFVLLASLGLLLGACNNGNNNPDPGPGPDPIDPAKDPTLSVTEKTIKVDEEFTLTINDVPEEVTPVWSIQGTAATFTLTSMVRANAATVKGVEVGEATITIMVGEKTLTCRITVTEKDPGPGPGPGPEPQVIDHLDPFVTNVTNPSQTRDFKEDFDLMVEDFSGANPSGTTTGNFTDSFLRVLVDSEDTNEPTTPDAAIYKVATGSYAIESFEGIGFKMRMLGEGTLGLDNLVLALRGDDTFKVFEINLADALDTDGEALPELTNEYQNYVIAPGLSIEDANTVYELAAGGDSSVKVLDKILGFHLYALDKECAAILEISEVYLINAGEKTVLDSFARSEVGLADSTCWWRGSTGFIVQKGVTLKGAKYESKDISPVEHENVVFNVLGDTSGLKINDVAYANLRDAENNSLTGAVNGKFTSYVINIANSQLDVSAGKLVFESTTEVVISKIFLSNLINELPAETYPLIDIQNASYVSKFDFTVAKGTLKESYEESVLDTRITDAGLNYMIAYHNGSEMEIDGKDLVISGGNFDYAHVVIGSNANASNPFLVFAIKGETLPTGLRIKSGANPEVWAPNWVADTGLASFNYDDDYPYVTADGYRLVIIDLAKSGFEGWNNEIILYYTGGEDLVIGSIFFADHMSDVVEGDNVQLYDPATNPDLSGYQYLGGFDIPADAKYLRMRLSSVAGATLTSIRFTANGEKWFKDGKIVDLNGNPISGDTVIPANGFVDIDIDLVASDMSGAAGVHSGADWATGDATLVSVKVLNKMEPFTVGDEIHLYDPTTNPDLSGYLYLGGFDIPADAKFMVIEFSTVSGATLTSIRFTANGEKWIKDGKVIGVDGEAFSGDLEIAAGETLRLFIDLTASEMSGAVGVHSGADWATGDITLVAANVLVKNDLYAQAMAAYNG